LLLIGTIARQKFLSTTLSTILNTIAATIQSDNKMAVAASPQRSKQRKNLR